MTSLQWCIIHILCQGSKESKYYQIDGTMMQHMRFLTPNSAYKKTVMHLAQYLSIVASRYNTVCFSNEQVQVIQSWNKSCSAAVKVLWLTFTISMPIYMSIQHVFICPGRWLHYVKHQWWCHDMGSHSALLGSCDENPPVTVGFLHKGPLTHWGRVTHVCVDELAIIGSDNGLSPGRRQAIIWNNAGILLIGPLGTNVSEILIGTHMFSFKKLHLEMSAKWRSFCLGLNVLMRSFYDFFVGSTND